MRVDLIGFVFPLLATVDTFLMRKIGPLLICWVAVAVLPQVALSQTGPGWDFVRSVPFTLMGRVRGHPETFDADLYAAANYTALLNGEARVEILDEIQARGLPWHHHV